MSKKKNARRAIPKRIAGMKVPKALRKSVGKALEFGDTPAMRRLVASTLIAAAAALAGNEAGDKAKAAAKDAFKALKHGNPEDMADAIGAAMSAALGHWFGKHDTAAPVKAKSGKAAPAAVTH